VQIRHSRLGVVVTEYGKRRHAFALQPVRRDTQRVLRRSGQTTGSPAAVSDRRRSRRLRTWPQPRSGNSSVQRPGRSALEAVSEGITREARHDYFSGHCRSSWHRCLFTDTYHRLSGCETGHRRPTNSKANKQTGSYSRGRRLISFQPNARLGLLGHGHEQS
jgi:hypothetical protein